MDDGLDPSSPTVIVAGHICLDIIPTFPPREGAIRFRPGALETIGPATVATGGAVSNVGLDLTRLGVPTRLLAKVGDDPFAALVRAVLRRESPGLDQGLVTSPESSTSYSIILSPPGQDRMFFHFPGANDTFTGDEISDDGLRGARLFHFGYPPTMRLMYEDGGARLRRLLDRARNAGLTTVLDMAYPDPSAPAGSADWKGILASVLPAVDVYLPSLEETLLMLEPAQSRELALGGSDLLESAPVEKIVELGEQILQMGVGIAGIKAGSRGLYLRTRSGDRVRSTGLDERWDNRQIWSAPFSVEVRGTTGAGDAAVAGFILGVLRAMTPEEAMTAACSAAAACVEAVDASSGVPSWDVLSVRIRSGWPRARPNLGPDWRECETSGVWRGPLDSG